jgi:hypothetical protein
MENDKIAICVIGAGKDGMLQYAWTFFGGHEEYPN